MEKILVPTDFSEEADNALNLAVDIASKNGSELVLLNIVEVPSGSGLTSFNVEGEMDTSMGAGMDDVFVVKMIERSKKKIKELATDNRLSNIHVHTTVEIGNAFAGISKAIKDHEVSLIIMGTKGSSGWEEILVGSNTEKVVRRAKCPVIAVKHPVKLDDIEDIVFATNLEAEQSHVVNELVKLQKLTKGKLHIVRINTPNNFDTSRSIKRQMEAFVKNHQLQNYTLNIYDDVVEEDGIVRFSEDIDADMIAMATHGRTGFMHILSGSIAEDIVNHAKRPVWTFRIKE